MMGCLAGGFKCTFKHVVELMFLSRVLLLLRVGVDSLEGYEYRFGLFGMWMVDFDSWRSFGL